MTIEKERGIEIFIEDDELIKLIMDHLDEKQMKLLRIYAESIVGIERLE